MFIIDIGQIQEFSWTTVLMGYNNFFKNESTSSKSLFFQSLDQ